MARSKATIMNLIIWTIFLKSIMALNLPQSAEIDSLPAKKFQQLPTITARSLFDQYTLGQAEEGAKIIYTYQFTQTFDEEQDEISLDFHYPDDESENGNDEEDENGEENEENSLIITQIQLYVKAEDGAVTQAYISDGGIGKNYISLQIIANHSNLLNYMLVIYGKEA